MSTGLHAPYFVATARKALDNRLAAYGFAYAAEPDSSDARAYWRSGSLFFRAGFLSESSPKYELVFGTGYYESVPSSPDLALHAIGVWRLLPPEDGERIANWTFDGSERLEHELRRAWDEAIEPYVVPYWKDEHELRRVVGEEERRLAREQEGLLRETLLERARHAFQAGHDRLALRAYEQLPAHALTPADRKRVSIARRRAEDSRS